MTPPATPAPAEGAAALPPRRSEWVTTVDTVFPHHANPLGTIFGGRVLELLDVNAAVACQRFARKIVVTASTEPIDFRSSVHVGEILEVKSRVAWTGRTSMIVRCEVVGENPLTGDRRLCTMGHMNFVALDDDGRPTAVPPVLVETAEEREHFAVAAAVRAAILRRREGVPSGSAR
jgi:acyl-CoA hydrolase